MQNRRAFIAGSAAAAAASLAAVDGCASHALAPPPLEGEALYTLAPAYATHRMLGYRLRTRTYGGNLAGPILETAPGQTLAIRVVNGLPPNPPERVPDRPIRIPLYERPSMGAMEMRLLAARGRRMPTTLSTHISVMNNPHAFNTTNLHVHGIQTIPHLFDPVGTSDPAAMMIAIEPGESFTYEFPIPPDHPSGLYWYHPHHHGATDVQVAGGMAGLLVVRGPIDEVPAIKAAREIFVAIQSLCLNPSPGDPKLLQYEFVAYRTPYPDGPGYNCAFDYMIVTTNNEPVTFVDYTKPARGFTSVSFTQYPPPEYEMQPGEVVRLRVLNGTNFMYVPLTLPGMEAYVIARDGINLPAPVLLDQSDPVTKVDVGNMYAGTSVDLPPGGRAELLVRAGRPGRYTLRCVATEGVADMNYATIDLAHFVVSGESVSMSVPESLPLPVREYPRISEGEIVATRALEFSEASSTEILTGVAFLLDGKSYDETRVDWRPRVGTAEAWHLTNTSSEGHPFHIHTNSFEVHAVNGRAIPVTIRDTIWIPPAAGSVPGSVDIRIRYKQWRGKDVLHCHILPHEDQGMMQNLLLG
jgi:suppressor of ftsI